ncbi:MAG: TRAP transporter large permease subunit, partial [Burkholderiaceae bacterium]
TRLDPNAAPGYQAGSVSIGEKLLLVVRDVIPMFLVVAACIGAMVTGISTPTEAAAVGCLAVMVLAAAYRVLTIKAIRSSLAGAMRVTVMSFFIILGSATFSQLLAFSGASSGLIEWATSYELAPLAMLFMMIGIILLLGCFMDQLSMMLLTAPIFFPLAQTLGFDLTWFGLILLLALEVGYTTPPFGLLLFVMKGVAPSHITMRDVWLAATPFVACVLGLILLVIFVPSLALWLPGLSH